jgi:hypothetical protein
MTRSTNPDPDKLPVIGTSWQTRGLDYWSRRACYTFLMAITVAVETAVLYGIWQSISFTTGRVIFVLIEGGLSLITGGVIFVGMRRMGTPKDRSQKRPSSAVARRAGTVGAAIGIMSGIGSILGALFIVLGSLLTYGLVLTLLVRSLLPRLDVERQAAMKKRPVQLPGGGVIRDE